MNNTPRERFIHFIHKREEMREHKQLVGGPGPHSDDPILANYSFCNINREHDTVTKFIHEHFRVPFYKRGRTFMVRQMLYCRIFNEPEVLKQVCPLDDAYVAIQRLKAYRKRGFKLMRGAYMMPPHGKGAGEGDIVDHWINDVVEAATGRKEFPLQGFDYTYDTKLEQIAAKLMTVCGIGPFIANQVCTDMRYIPEWGHIYSDWDSFILCGPGTRRGMNRFFGRELLHPDTDAKFTAELLEIRESLWADLSEQIQQYYLDPNNLSNSFCEFDKWERGHQQLANAQEVTLRKWKVKDDPQMNLLLQ